MAHQVHNFVMRLLVKVNIYQLAVLSLGLGLVIAGMPGGGGGGGLS